jgi:methionine sulfoxide reductase heme-binding subunit
VIAAVHSSGSTQALWYLTRATGLVSLVLLTLVMVLGIAQIERWTPRRWPRFVTAALHRNASLLAVVFLVVHIVTAVADPFAPISLVSAVVPFASPYRTLWLGLGAVAFDLILALVVTSLMRERIGYRTWRVVHWAAYLCWPVAFVHGLGTGSDGRVSWVLGVDLVCLVAVLASVIWRLAANWQLEPGRRAAGAVASALVLVVVLGWAATGPTQPGWASKAGTPRSLLSSARATAATRDPSTSSSPPSTGGSSAGLTLPLHTAFQGGLTQSGDGSDTTVVILATFAGPTPGRLRVVLQGTALDDGGLALRRGSVAFGPADHPATWSGSVTGLAGAHVTAQVTTPGEPARLARIDLTIDAASQHVSGTLDVA